MKRQKIVVVGFVFLVIFNIFNVYSSSDLFLNATNQIGTDSSPRNPTAAASDVQWIQNPTFTDNTWWYSEAEFDETDVAANISGGQANYIITGNGREISLADSAPTPANWTAVVNPEFQVWPQFKDTGLPTYSITPRGWAGSHSWTENRNGANGSAGILYKRNYTLPLNLSDYTITSLSVDAVFDANVITVGVNQGGIEILGDVGIYGAVYDFARVYIEISNLAQTSTYQLAYNTTGKLGLDSLVTEMMNNTHFELSYPEDILIAYLTNVLASGDYQNLTVVVGIDFHCEKNSASDDDVFKEVIVKNFNLTFTVEKRITQQTAIAWKQDGNTFYPGTTVDDALLSFYYWINPVLWPISSPNSEIRIRINADELGLTIPLLNATQSLQRADFDVKKFIEAGKSVNLSLKVYIADNFLYDSNLTVSIDSVQLDINYTYTGELYSTDPLSLYLNGTYSSLDPTFDIPLGSVLNITVIYENNTGRIPGAKVELSWFGNVLGDFWEDTAHQQYTFNITADDDIKRGQNLFGIKAMKLGYVLQIQDPSLAVNVRKINATLASATGSYIVNVAPESDALLEVLLYDEDAHIPITGVVPSFTSSFYSGILTDIDSDGILECQIPNVPEGSHPVYISVAESDYYAYTPPSRELTFTLNALNSLLIQTNYTLLLNGTDITSTTPTFTTPIYTTLNLTVRYVNATNKVPLLGASVTLIRAGLGYTYNFTPNGEQYTLLLNSSENLLRGPNNLDLKIRKSGFSSNYSSLQITVRKYDTEIALMDVTGPPDRVDLKPGGTVTIKIYIQNLDLSTFIKGMSISFSWQFGEGTMTDDNHDGIYETTLENIPEGSYPVLITVYSDENYAFESYDITVAAMRTPEEIFAQNMILIIAIAGAVIFGSYFALYQLKWKYPPFVRMIRQVRRDVKKGRRLTASLGIESRTDLIENVLQKDVAILGIKRKSYLTAVELPATRKTEKPQEVKKIEKAPDAKKPASTPPQDKSKVKEIKEKGKLENNKKPKVKPTEVKPGEKVHPDVKPTNTKPSEKVPIEKSATEPSKKPDEKLVEVKSEVKLKTENLNIESGKNQDKKPPESKNDAPTNATGTQAQPAPTPQQSKDPKKEPKESKPDTINPKDGE